MVSEKDQIEQLANPLLEDASFGQIFRRIAFARMIEKDLADSRANRTISNEEMNRRYRTVLHGWKGPVSIKYENLK